MRSLVIALVVGLPLVAIAKPDWREQLRSGLEDDSAELVSYGIEASNDPKAIRAAFAKVLEVCKPGAVRAFIEHQTPIPDGALAKAESCQQVESLLVDALPAPVLQARAVAIWNSVDVSLPITDETRPSVERFRAIGKECKRRCAADQADAGCACEAALHALVERAMAEEERQRAEEERQRIPGPDEDPRDIQIVKGPALGKSFRVGALAFELRAITVQTDDGGNAVISVSYLVENAGKRARHIPADPICLVDAKRVQRSPDRLSAAMVRIAGGERVFEDTPAGVRVERETWFRVAPELLRAGVALYFYEPPKVDATVRVHLGT